MTDCLPFSLGQVKEWAGDYPTPFYIYDEEGITENVKEIYSAFSWNKGFREYFAVKATPTPAIIRLLASLGCGTDCASQTEIMLSERSGVTGNHIIFSSNETRPEEYTAAVNAGAIINFDDITQIDRLLEVCDMPDSVCCRYNPGSFADANDIMGHLYDSKFGMTKDQLFSAFEILKSKGAKRFGIHAMLASCCLDDTYYGRLSHELFSLVLEIREKLGITVAFIDLAGGVGIPYRPGEKKVDIRRVAENVRKEYEALISANGLSLDIYTEMGRFITGPYGYLITKVIGTKDIYKKYIGVDATACDLMRPAIYGAYHHITVLGKENEENKITADVVGSLCENNDKFAVDRSLPEVELGDYLVIQDAGAHGRSMGYNYNGKMRCGELMLHADKTVSLIRRRETPEDIFVTFDCDEEFSCRK